MIGQQRQNRSACDFVPTLDFSFNFFRKRRPYKESEAQNGKDGTQGTGAYDIP